MLFKQYTAEYQVDTLTFQVKVLGERRAYGRKEYLCVPLKGRGEKWITEGNLLKLTTIK